LSFDKEFDFSNELDLTSINEDNRNFIQMLVTFSMPLLSFVQTFRNIELLLTYFVNVLCHSSFEDKVRAFTSFVKKCISEQNAHELVLSFFKEHFQDTVQCIVIPTPLTFAEAIADLMSSAFHSVPLEMAFEFSALFLGRLSSLRHDSLAQIPRFFPIFHSFLQLSEDAVSLAVQRGWFNEMLEFISLIFDGRQKEQFYRFVNYSRFFQSLMLVVDAMPPTNCDQFLEIAKQALHSPAQITAFVLLISSAAANHGLNVDAFMDLAFGLKDLPKETLNSIVCLLIPCPAFADRITAFFRKLCDGAVPKYRAVTLLSVFARHIEDGHPTLAKYVFTNLPSIFEFFLTSVSRETRLACERFFNTLLPTFPLPGRFQPRDFMADFMMNSEWEFRPILETTVLPKWDGFMQHIQTHLLTRLYTDSPMTTEVSFLYDTAIRIWHFFAVGLRDLTPDRFAIVFSFIEKVADQQVVPDYHLIALLNFALDFPLEIVGPVLNIIFDTCFDGITTYNAATYQAYFAIFLHKFPPSPTDEMLAVLRSHKLICLLSHLDNQNLTSFVDRITDYVYVNPGVRDVLSEIVDKLGSTRVALDLMEEIDSIMSPEKLADLVRECFALLVRLGVQLNSSELEFLKRVIKIVITTMQCDLGNVVIELRFEDWLRLWKNPARVFPDIGELVKWCCEHHRDFAVEFVRTFPVILLHADLSQKAVLAEAAARTIVRTGDSQALAECAEKLDSAFIEHARSQSTLENLDLFYRAIGKVDADECYWAAGFVYRVLERRPISSVAFRFCRNVVRQVTPPLAVEMWERLAGGVLTATGADPFLSQILRMFLDVRESEFDAFCDKLPFTDAVAQNVLSGKHGTSVRRDLFAID
jgi:hypothetical protein